MKRDTRIAFLGTGLMGAPMAGNLLTDGFAVNVWNRTSAKTEGLVARGAQAFANPAGAAAGSDLIISMLSDGPATAALQADPALRAALRPGMIWIEMASVKPEEAQAQAGDLAGLGVDHLDAPVSGGTKGAAAASLAIMVGGAPAVFERAEAVLCAMGRPVHVGPSGTGELAKLANQAIVGNAIAAVAEAMLLVSMGGADPAAVRQALKGGFADSTILQQHGARMSSGDFAPGGLSRLQLKDLDNVLDQASQFGLELPATQQTRDRFLHLCTAMQDGDLDHSGLYLELLARNGLSEDIG